MVTAVDCQKDETLQTSKIGDSDTPLLIKDDFVLLEILGQGGFGTVQKAYHKRLEKYVALKSFLNHDVDSLEQINLEDDLLLRIEEIRKKEADFHFLIYYGVFKKQKGDLVLQMESGISTLDDLLAVGKVYQCDELMYVLRILVKGFAILQRNRIANRDIKAQNIIIVENKHIEKEFFYKISDFGIGSTLPTDSDLMSCRLITGLTTTYAAPELIELFKKVEIEDDFNELYNPFKADVYALGILVLKMINYTYGKKALNKGLLSNKSIFSEYEDLMPILEKMLEENPQNRPDFINLDDLFEENNDNLINVKKYCDENKYYHIWREEKERKLEKDNKAIEALYNEHKQLYITYYRYLTRLKKAKYHLELAFEKIKLLENFDKTNPNQENTEKININLDEEHIYCLNYLGDLHKKLGNLKKSEEFLTECSVHCEKYHKNNGKSIEDRNYYYYANLYDNYGSLYSLMGHLVKAEEYYIKSLHIKLDIYGENNRDTAASYNNLGLLYNNMRNFAKAEEYYQKSLKIKLALHGENHGDTAAFYNNMGSLYKNMKDLTKAENFYMKSLKIKQKIFGEDNSDTATSYNNLGALYDQMENYEKAKEFHLKALKIRLDHYGENHGDTATSYNNLGSLYEVLGNMHKAEEYYLKSLKIWINLHGENHNETAITCNHLGFLYRNMENLQKAEEFYMKALKIRLHLHGEKYEDTAKIYHHLGMLYAHMRNLTKAEEYYHKSLKVRIDLYGENHETHESYHHLGLLYKQMGNHEKGEEFNQKALKLKNVL